MSDGPNEVLVKREAMTLERIALSALIALLSWNVYTTQSLSTEQAVTNAKLQGFSEQFNLLTLDRYTRSEATADKALIIQRLERLEQWSQSTTERLRELERIKHGSEK